MHSRRSRSISQEVFAKLGKEKRLHEYCSVIFKLLGLVVDYISAADETLRLSSGVRFNPFCTAVRSSGYGSAECCKCDIANAWNAAKEKKPVCYRCHAGLYDVAVPLFDHEGNYLGCMTSGQFLLAGAPRMSKNKIFQLAAKCGLEKEELYQAYQKSLTITDVQQEGIIEYLTIIGKHITGVHENLAYMDKINTPERIDVIKKYIEEHYNRPLSLSTVARKHFISPSGLAHSFKKEMHVSFNAYLNSYRITKARELLEDTLLPVAEIAVLTGFGSVSQFNRVFRKETGKSAGAYRKEKS